MAHAPGWVELYEFLEAGRTPQPELVSVCRTNRNGLGETALHWYAIEGAAEVLQKLVDLGFDVDNVNECGTTPILDSASTDRWDNVRVLRLAGAGLDVVSPTGDTYRSILSEKGAQVPDDLQGDAYSLEDILDPTCPAGTKILSLTITSDGAVPREGSLELTAATWAEYLAANPGVDQDDFAFESDGPGPHVAVYGPSATERQRCHHIAKSFGARVIWALCCPETA